MNFHSIKLLTYAVGIIFICNSPISLANIKASLLPCNARCGTQPDIWQENLRQQQRQHVSFVSRDYSAIAMRRILTHIYQHVMQTTVFMSDMDAYGKRDIFPTREQLELAKENGIYRGDCTTYSHRFYYELIDAGIHPDRIKRVRIDRFNRPGKISNHMAVLVDGTYLLDSAAPAKRVTRFEQITGTPKLWLSENDSGWFQGALGQSPLVNNHFKGFSLSLHH